MVNPHRGEVEITLDDQVHVMRMTLGALVSLEALIGPVVDLVERFEAGRANAEDVLAVLLCGLNGNGWSGDADALRLATIRGGYVTAIERAAELLTLSFGGHHD